MRVIVATVPLTGHVQPMLLVVRGLVERGHDVTWYAGRKFAARIEATGARFVPRTLARDWDDADIEAALPALRGTRGLARVRTQLHEMFIAPMLDELRDLEALVDARGCDAILADQAHVGAALAAETRGIPWAGLGISALVIPSTDTAPFGAARPPARNDVDRRVYRGLSWFIQRVLFRGVNRAFLAGRVSAGLPAGDATYFDLVARDLFLQPTIPSFEYPRSDLPPQVRFIGPLVPAPADVPLPAWWPDVLGARERGTPVVLITQGTLATNPRELVGPAARGLARSSVLVVATTGATPQSVGLRAWPENMRVAPYVPYEALLRHTTLLVTNGGYGGVQMALRHGVPVIVAGGSEEKPEIAARVAWSGAGIDLRTGRPSARKVRRAVERVLAEPAFAARSRALAAECARYDAVQLAVEAIESLATSDARRKAS